MSRSPQHSLIKRTLNSNIFDNSRYKKSRKLVEKQLSSQVVTTSKTAVVLHLYYVDMWPQLEKKLKTLERFIHFDLFVTMPSRNRDYTQTIKRSCPQAIIFVVPNRGRDVLPFIKLAPLLLKHEYQVVLKLHSKKSTHRNDGSKWFDELLGGLIPQSKWLADQLQEKLEDTATGVIGPDNQYLQLTVNFEANGVHMTNLLNNVIKDKVKVQNILQEHRNEYGFFAGTMFWARLDALQPIIEKCFRPRQFEVEAGQIDGTLAHALERIFCLLPEVENRKMYSIGPSGVHEIRYDAGTIPDWSDIYIGPNV